MNTKGMMAVVYILGACAIILCIAIAYCAVVGREVSAVAVSVASGILGGLGSVLVLDKNHPSEKP